MSKYLSEAGLCRALGYSLPKIKRAIRLGIITPSGTGQRGALYNSAFVSRWRDAMSTKPETVATESHGETLSSDCPIP